MLYTILQNFLKKLKGNKSVINLKIETIPRLSNPKFSEVTVLKENKIEKRYQYW
jgi:hypothetical protein